jgi:hypothetical protein
MISRVKAIVPSPTCTLSISVCRADLTFMMHTIPHLVRMCNHPFLERTLVLDTAPLAPRYRADACPGALDALRRNCAVLVSDGVVDRVVEIDYSEECRQSTYLKHLARDIPATHDFRGYPVLGAMFAIECAKGEFFLHFDSDILLYQAPGNDWVSQGMNLISRNDELLFVGPHPGPPPKDGVLKQRGVPYCYDDRGFVSFKRFTSRRFLMKRERFFGILPLEPAFLSGHAELETSAEGASRPRSWESMVRNRIDGTPFLRGDLNSPHAWTLHTPDHGPVFIEALPEIIRKLESGWFPPGQVGDFDLQLAEWL